MLQVSKSKSKTSKKSSTKKKKYTYTSPEKRKLKFSDQRKVDTAAKGKVARKQHDVSMRSSGRKVLATDYPRKGEKKKK